MSFSHSITMGRKILFQMPHGMLRAYGTEGALYSVKGKKSK
jgi:hypothetical protein